MAEHRARYAWLDGLRGSAALFVVYYHFLLLTGLTARPGGGHIGVLMFFVLSGYLITRVLLAHGAEPGRETYAKFVRRRLVRLYPALVGVVCAAGPVMAWVGPETLAQEARAAGITLVQASAFFQLADVPPADGWLHAWSLTVEWCFYLLWPIVFLALRHVGLSLRRQGHVALSLAAACYVLSLPLTPYAFYLSPVTNAAPMLLGATIALRHGDGARSADHAHRADMGMVLLAIIAFMPSNVAGLVHYRYSYFIIGVAAACAIVHYGAESRGVARLLIAGPLAAIGRASYSLYLWHLPVLWIVWWGFPSLTPAVRAALALVVLAPCVYVSYVLLERPWLKEAPRPAPAHQVRSSSPAVS